MVWNKKGKPSGNGDRGKPKYNLPSFWVTCPDCKKKIAVPADWVFKYLERVIGYEDEEPDTSQR